MIYEGHIEIFVMASSLDHFWKLGSLQLFVVHISISVSFIYVRMDSIDLWEMWTQLRYYNYQIDFLNITMKQNISKLVIIELNWWKLNLTYDPKQSCQQF